MSRIVPPWTTPARSDETAAEPAAEPPVGRVAGGASSRSRSSARWSCRWSSSRSSPAGASSPARRSTCRRPRRRRQSPRLAGLPRLAIVGADGRLVTMDAMGGALTPARAGRASGSASRPGRRTARGSRSSARPTRTPGSTSSRPASGRPRRRPIRSSSTGARTARRSTCTGRPTADESSFLTTEPRGLALRVAPADASAPGDRRPRPGRRCTGHGQGPDRLLVHSGAGGTDAFFGEIAPDGTAPEPAATADGDFRAPAISADARFRGYGSPATATPEQVVVESRRSDAIRHASACTGRSALDFGPVGTDLAFIAAERGRHPRSALPLGPLRLIDAASGAVRTLLPDSVVAFFWSPDGSTIAGAPARVARQRPGRRHRPDRPGEHHRRARAVVAASTAARATAAGTALRIVFVTAGSGAIVSQRTVRLSDAFIQQVLPYFDQYALSHRLWSPDGAASCSRSSRTTAPST